VDEKLVPQVWGNNAISGQKYRGAPGAAMAKAPIQIEQDWMESSALTAHTKTISSSIGRRFGI
jgi:hypothetical protein